MNETETTRQSTDKDFQDQVPELRKAVRTLALRRIELHPQTPSTFFRRQNRADKRLKDLTEVLLSARTDSGSVAVEAAFWSISTMQRVMHATLEELASMGREINKLPRVILDPAEPGEPRVLDIASTFVATCRRASVDALLIMLRGLQEHEVLTVAEIWHIPHFLKFALVEEILLDAETLLDDNTPEVAERLQFLSEDLQRISTLEWTIILEPLIAFNSLLCSDPAASFAAMDFDSREAYRQRIAFIARNSDCSELEVATHAIQLAQSAAVVHCEARQRRRRLHVGYYLFEEGFSNLRARVGYHPPLSQRLRELVRATPSDFYITGIQLVTLIVISLILFPLLGSSASFMAMMVALLLLIMPVMQSAMELVNSIINALFEPEVIPKMDFSGGIPADCSTLVAIPTLLLSKSQVQQLVWDLEVRYLGNRSNNLHFALLTNLPDSISRPVDNDHDLVFLAIKLIKELNSKYSSPGSGRFLLLHRRSTFNIRQGVCMGWERKRGKLLELNRLLMGKCDAFPIKAGPTEILTSIRYVLTLDSDTQLPRDTAYKLVGAMAHPLNQAVIDPHRRIVTHGYGILQPRIGVSVKSQVRSRLAKIYSGQSGLDIYSRAVSDVYQDLYREGIYTGKGIYEVQALDHVLENRFPKNSLLSHDLIEGAYARAGLVTDVELIDDYPSHYTAYMRRKHRWVRGDWQIAQWMFNKVPSESGVRTSTPLSAISRWKIFDNLRRSLVEPFTLSLFIAGWFLLPGGPFYWTIVSLAVFLLPTFVQLLFTFARAVGSDRPGRFIEFVSSLGKATAAPFLNLCFLPHQAILAMDAIFRSLIRQFITGKRLLEWETAAQAEATQSNIIDRFLLVIPILACGLGIRIYFQVRGRGALAISAAVLGMWCLATVLTAWLNRAPRLSGNSLGHSSQRLLMIHALRIWRYFSEFGGESHNFLIPDNVEEEDRYEAPRVSPTNIGFLLNARQVACELGFLSVPEFVKLSLATLNTIVGVDKYRGHLYNWYDTKACRPLDEFPMVSTVDSGNLVASLYALAAGTRRLLTKPLLDPCLFQGIRAHLEILKSEHRLPPLIADGMAPKLGTGVGEWLIWVQYAMRELPAKPLDPGRRSKDWWAGETGRRLDAIQTLVGAYLPWLHPSFAPLRDLLPVLPSERIDSLSIDDAIQFAQQTESRLLSTIGTASEQDCLSNRFYAALETAQRNLLSLKRDLHNIALQAEQLATDTEFSFLLHPDRQVLSIGFDVRRGKLHDACYDMLASEARMATFIAIARNEIPQRIWFRLAREYTKAYGRYVLQSWTGTTFEYLMPALWMRFYPGTILGESFAACIQVQRAFARKLRIPWGISESGMARKDDGGHYLYRAFGIPAIAVSAESTAGPVVSPYSTYLALCVEPKYAVRNLRRMTSAGWMGDYGLYEAGDFSVSMRNCELVREWMAHHQGMSLIAILNCLKDDVAQQWFHGNPAIESAELLLSELAPSHARLKKRSSVRSLDRTTTKARIAKRGFAFVREAVR